MAVRISSLDSLRGLAIFFMMIDHFFGIVLLSTIEPFNVRFFMRIAEPLFAILLGYLLVGRSMENLKKRFFEIAGAALFVNAFFFPILGKFEILASFIVCYLLFMILQEKFVFLLPLILLLPIDPSSLFFDFPISLVVSQIALGMLFRERKNIPVAISFFLFVLSFIFAPSEYKFIPLFTILAVLFVEFAQNNEKIRVPILEEMGKRPLASYIIQYVIIVLIALVWFYTSGKNIPIS